MVYSELKDYYKIMGVSQNASKEEIKKKYRELVKIWHPDNCKEDNADKMFVSISEAYEVLKDSVLRAEYDKLLAESRRHTSKHDTSHDEFNNWDYFKRKQEYARQQAEYQATQTLEEILATLFYGEEIIRPELTFWRKNKIGFKIIFLGVLFVISFTFIGAIPAVPLIIYIIRGLFYKNNFVGLKTVIQGSVIAILEVAGAILLMVFFVNFDNPFENKRYDNKKEEEYVEESYIDSYNEQTDLIDNSSHTDYATEFIVSSKAQSLNIRASASLNSDVICVANIGDILYYAEESLYDEKDDIKWYKVYHKETNNEGWASGKYLVKLLDANEEELIEKDSTDIEKIPEKDNTNEQKDIETQNNTESTYEIEEKDAEAQNNLAITYYEGNGVKQDYDKAIEWFIKSANQGNIDAQYNLGIIYQEGRITEQDYRKAIEWYTKSADQGNPNAQNNLGFMYKNGYGVEQDYKKAVECYMKASEKENSNAQYNLGVAYEDGDGVEQNYII